MRNLALLLCVAASVIIVAACGGGGGGGSSSVPSESPYLAFESIGPEGGAVEVADPDSPYYGAKVEIPAGALDGLTTITMEAMDDGSFPTDSLPIRLQPEGLEFNIPVRVTIPYSESFLNTWEISDEAQLALFSLDESTGEWLGLTKDQQDESGNLVSALTPHFSAQCVMPVGVWALHYLQEGFVDPTVGLPYSCPQDLGLDSFDLGDIFDIGAIPVNNFSSPRYEYVGKGSLQNLSDLNQRNLILIHGLLSNALTFQFKLDDDQLGSSRNYDDLVDSLWDDYDNIILFQYNSGRRMDTIYAPGEWDGIEDWEEWWENREILDMGTSHLLADEFRRYNIPLYNVYPPAGTGFTDIIAHSMGGLIARVAIEHEGGEVRARNLITIGTPHLGVRELPLEFQVLFNRFLAGGPGQLLSNSGVGIQFFSRMNDDYQFDPPGERYLLIAGDSGGGSDGWVEVGSATGLPLDFDFGEDMHTFVGSEFTHAGLHVDAKNNGVVSQIKTWIYPPIIECSPRQITIETTTGNNPAPFTVSISNSGGGVLEWSLEVIATGGPWFTITPTSGSVATGETDSMLVLMDTTTELFLPAGTYENTLFFGGVGIPGQRSIQITLIITD